jgi:hypothetical protein
MYPKLERRPSTSKPARQAKSALTPGPGEPVTGGANSRGPSSRFAIVVVLVAAFSAFLVYNEDPWALGRFVVTGTAYLVAVGLSIALLATTWKKSALVLLLGTIVVLGGVYAISGGNGYPSANTFYSSTYRCVTTTGGLNSSGYPMPGTRTSCTADDFPYQDIPLALGYNLLAWVPLVGCVLFSMPAWSGEGTSRRDDLGRLLGGSAPAAAILMNLVGIQVPGTLVSLPVLHLPLNPYPAYGMCDSTTSTIGCVYVNQLYVLADYAFWIGVTALASLAVSAVVSRRMRAGAALRKAAPYSLALALVLVIGLAVVPASITESGVLVYPGNSFSFNPANSFVRMPFTAGHSETLSGAFESSAPVDAYVLNSSQFLSFDSGGGGCPSSPTALLGNATSGSISTGVGSGSYGLIFCRPFQPDNFQSIQVKITSTLKLSG